MPNTSATGGYLLPDGVLSTPDEDDVLDAAFQKAIAGITGLAGPMVRPRWQTVVPTQPEPTVNWCAFGVMSQAVQDGPYIQHNSSGSDTLSRHEDISILCTFYGPSCHRFAMVLRDGLHIPQNVYALRAGGVSFIDAGLIRTLPEFVNQQWIRRADIPVRFRRQVSRTYSVLNILAADITFVNDDHGVIGTIHV
jgi:hypothetical protein